jgi:exosortase A
MLLKPPPGVDNTGAAPDTGAGPRLLAPMLVSALALLSLFALYFPTVASIVSIWNSSETFAHGYVILPISLWLVWRRRENFRSHPPTPWWPALLPLALAGAGWFAARLGEVQVVMQYAFVAMIPLGALALFGRRLAGSLAFPLLFLLFAVPFGEVFVAPLIDFTANFTVWAVQATGIPVLRSGTHFELPTGSWSVVEACSGVRYLISSVTLGCLYAYLTYRSSLRRAMFIALSVVVPVFANGMRAYMIVMMGHFSGMTVAVGVDHLIYGWLFFGLVMFIMFWIGSYWREDTSAEPVVAAPAGEPAAPAPAARIAAMAAAVFALAAVWPALAQYVDRANTNPAPVQLPAVASTWQAAPAFTDWQLDYMAPDARFDGAFRSNAADRPVGLTVLYYRNQDKQKALISSLNRLAAYKDTWHVTASSQRTETVAGQVLTLRESTLEGQRGALLVWDWMSIGERRTTSNVVGKLWQTQSKLLLRGDDGALVVMAAPYNENPDAARAALRAFAADNLRAVDAALAAARSH